MKTVTNDFVDGKKFDSFEYRENDYDSNVHWNACFDKIEDEFFIDYLHFV